MNLESKAAHTPDIAFLCQNHHIYLEHAAKIGEREPERKITFRTSATWRSGKAALVAHGPRKVYFISSTEGGLVEYVAKVEYILLEPTADDPATNTLLSLCLPETQDQGLWEAYGEKVRTLYVISHCRWLEMPFSYTQLTKLSDGQKVDENYNYGYVLVHDYCQVCKSSPCRC